jgi:hypothetical protein
MMEDTEEPTLPEEILEWVASPEMRQVFKTRSDIRGLPQSYIADSTVAKIYLSDNLPTFVHVVMNWPLSRKNTHGVPMAFYPYLSPNPTHFAGVGGKPETLYWGILGPDEEKEGE